MKHFGNGMSYELDERGRGVDTEGYMTSSITFITNHRTCVSVRMGEQITVRNSNDPDKTTVSFTRPEWSAFIAGAKLGEFDIVS